MFCVCNIFGDDIKLDYMHNVKNKEGHDSLLSLIDYILQYENWNPVIWKK